MLKITKTKGGWIFKAKIGKMHFNNQFYIEQKPTRTIGIRNCTTDGKYLVFLDYDNTLLNERLIPELKSFQKKYKLSSFYILQSSQKVGGYHAICLDKLKTKEWLKILEESSSDINYKNIPIYRDNKAWVLRCYRKGINEQPRLIKTVQSVYCEREKSHAHALFMNLNYGLRIGSLKNLDNNTNVLLTAYNTLNFMSDRDSITPLKNGFHEKNLTSSLSDSSRSLNFKGLPLKKYAKCPLCNYEMRLTRDSEKNNFGIYKCLNHKCEGFNTFIARQKK